MFDGYALERQAKREEAQARDDETFLNEVVEEIERGFKSAPNFRYTFILYRFEPGLTYPLRVPPWVLPIVRKILENFRHILYKMSRRAISPVRHSVYCTEFNCTDVFYD